MLGISETLRDLAQPQDMMDAATAALGRHLKVAQVGYGEIDAAQAHITVHRDWNDGRIPSVAGTWRMEDFGPAIVRDLKAGRTVAVADVADDLRAGDPAVVAAYKGIRTRSILDVPLVKHGRMVALLFVHHPEPRGWSDAEVKLVEQVGERLWAAVERARAERARDAGEAHLRAVLDALPVGVAICDAQGHVTRDNAAQRALWGMPPQAMSWHEYGDWVAWHGDSDRRVQAHEWGLSRALLHGDVVRGELVRCQPFDGSAQRYFLNNAAPVHDAQGRLVGGVAVTLDVTAQRAAQADRERLLAAEHAARAQAEVALASLQEREQQLAQARQRLDMALAAGRMGVWDWSLHAGHSHWNRQMFELLALPNAADGLASAEEFMNRVHAEDRPALDAALAKAFDTRGGFEMEMRLTRADGQTCWVLGRGEVVCDERGEVERMVGVNMDITAQKTAQAALAEALRAKEVLLYEVHHRVKNNLQVITSLLNLQADHAADPRLRTILGESCGRVKAMALTHQLLYERKDFSRLDLGDYLERLVHSIRATYRGTGDRITLRLALPEESVYLDLERAIPCGLLVNELVTNAFKHAFPAERSGEIVIELDENDELIRFSIADDGIGLPTEEELSTRSSLGLQLVPLLVEQLHGALKIERKIARDCGSRFSVNFPKRLVAKDA
jgi:two-component sensor histidine kinase/PAS domain-containing protein